MAEFSPFYIGAIQVYFRPFVSSFSSHSSLKLLKR